ncbi:MAG: acetolactate synthase small subunit [Candidatus Odinarchaeia archaeon]
MVKYIFSIIVDDEPGVMHRVVSIFSRRAVNIERISVGPSGISPGTARIILYFEAEPKKAKFMKNLLNRLINVKKISQFKSDNALIQELVIIRLRNGHKDLIKEMKNLTRKSSVRLIDDVKNAAIELVGPVDEIDSILQSIDKKHVLETVRSGIIALKK